MSFLAKEVKRLANRAYISLEKHINSLPFFKRLLWKFYKGNNSYLIKIIALQKLCLKKLNYDVIVLPMLDSENIDLPFQERAEFCIKKNDPDRIISLYLDFMNFLFTAIENDLNNQSLSSKNSTDIARLLFPILVDALNVTLNFEAFDNRYLSDKNADLLSIKPHELDETYERIRTYKNNFPPITIQDYNIGIGTYSKVYLGWKINGAAYKTVAIKRFNGNKTAESQEKEYNIQKSLLHPFIAEALEYIKEKSELILIYYHLGDLYHFITNDKLLDLSTQLEISYACAEGVRYLHDNLVLHCDLKPENILLEKTQDHFTVRIADFGEASFINEPQGGSFTKFYGAPELLNTYYSGGQRPYPHTIKSDIFALLLILVCIAIKKPAPRYSLKPPVTESDVTFFGNNIEKNLNQEFPSHEKYSAFIKNGLCFATSNRPTADAVVKAVQEEYLKP